MTIVAVQKNVVMATLAAFLVLFPVRFMAAAPADKLSDGDKQCLACHGLFDKNQALLGRGGLPYPVIARRV
jgi:hypothetical protein